MKLPKLNWKIAGSIAVITLVAISAVMVTRAYFSDTEVSRGNKLQAGAIDLKVDNTSYYNGELNSASSWQLANLDDGNGPSGDGQYLFFNFADLKPGDWGEDTISLHVTSNESWLCADVTLTNNDENDLTSAEARLQDTTVSGELVEEINFVWWADDGDNVLETDETVIQQANLGAAPLNIPVPVILADSTKNIWNVEGGPVSGNTTKYIGKAWCYGALTLAPRQPGDNSPLGPVENSGILCDNKNVSNLSQTDSAKLDVAFTAIQARHEGTFTCPKLRYPLTVTKAGTGTGTVASDVAGIACGADCTEDIYRTTVVTLTPTPDISSTFTGWTGACTGTGTCVVTMDEAKDVGAEFAIKSFTLSVSKTGIGEGTITSDPAGISYPGDVTETYTYGTIVNLTATPAYNIKFIGWTGVCTGTGVCSVTMNEAKNVSAEFILGDILAEWKFNEASGTTALDTSGYGNNGTITGAARVAGKNGTALEFTGDDYVSIPYQSSFDLGATSQFTIEYWFYRHSQAWHVAFSQLSTTYGMGMTANYASRFWSGSDEHMWTIARAVPDQFNMIEIMQRYNYPSLNVWHHVANVYNGTTMKTYIDGVQTGGTTNVTGIGLSPAANTTSLIGAMHQSSIITQYYDGLLDEMRIWKKALTPAEILSHYNNP